MEITFRGVIKEEIKKAYDVVFGRLWPTWLGGILMAVLALLIFLWNFPWGVSGGYRNWGEWVYYLINLKSEQPIVPHIHPVSVLNIGIIAGAFGSALLSRQFSIKKTSRLEYLKGAAGGVLMGIGSAFSGGCIEGAFYTAVGVYSMGGFAMMIGLIIGAYIGLKYLIWEIYHVDQPGLPEKPYKKNKPAKIDWKSLQPSLGLFVIFISIVAFYIYSFFDQTQVGGLSFLGIMVGLVMHRTRFCFVRAFRNPFMTGDSSMVQVLIMSLAIYALGSAVIKWSFLQPDTMGVYHPFWIGSLVGGVFFGIGMVVGGSCASSALWRVGEGNTKIMLALVCFCITNPVIYTLIRRLDILDNLGKGIYVPDVFSWYLTIPLYALFFLVIVFLAIWNEKTEKFVIF